MIKVSDKLWIGNSSDESRTNLGAVKITAVLNVAQDLQSTRGWRQGVEYAQVGLIDGPGNELADYCAALLSLKMLARRHERVLVCDHAGGRALVVALMYINIKEGQWRADPMAWSHWPTWKERSAAVLAAADVDLPVPHAVHTAAFDRIPWGLLEVL